MCFIGREKRVERLWVVLLKINVLRVAFMGGFAGLWELHNNFGKSLGFRQPFYK